MFRSIQSLTDLRAQEQSPADPPGTSAESHPVAFNDLLERDLRLETKHVLTPCLSPQASWMRKVLHSLYPGSTTRGTRRRIDAPPRSDCVSGPPFVSQVAS